jgi:hypothetical protein
MHIYSLFIYSGFNRHKFCFWLVVGIMEHRSCLLICKSLGVFLPPVYARKCNTEVSILWKPISWRNPVKSVMINL